ncbi:hypothetical protein OXPF_16180 [Oxobacter pfennigii]|uniref:Uncharacterized protein n=1 Tax=Oxobacter pfennigii TaxID=36849 RepID=A0A0P8YXP3_9CLOT|nr:hypothetical protein [Oxobacter pfennigii]KPU44535.1 hypothetical protein OXPF_16180 [Oxobacter pfennigii]
MDLLKLQNALAETFGDNNVKPYKKGFRVIVDYNNMPYCIVLRVENERFVMDRDAVDSDQADYEDAYKKAYKMFIVNKDKFNEYIDL